MQCVAHGHHSMRKARSTSEPNSRQILPLSPLAVVMTVTDPGHRATPRIADRPVAWMAVCRADTGADTGSTCITQVPNGVAHQGARHARVLTPAAHSYPEHLPRELQLQSQKQAAALTMHI